MVDRTHKKWANWGGVKKVIKIGGDTKEGGWQTSEWKHKKY